jgi:hypothetical protein
VQFPLSEKRTLLRFEPKSQKTGIHPGSDIGISREIVDEKRDFMEKIR